MIIIIINADRFGRVVPELEATAGDPLVDYVTQT